MGWAALTFLIFALCLLFLAARANATLTSADTRLGSAIFAGLSATCALIAVALWVLWVSFR